MAGIILAGDQQDGERRGLGPKPGGKSNGQCAQRERTKAAKSWLHGERLTSSRPGDNPNQDPNQDPAAGPVHKPRSVGACLFDSRQVPPGFGASGGTPPELAAEDGCATGLEVEKPALLDRFMVREQVQTEQETPFGPIPARRAGEFLSGRPPCW
jgi:hypothetical protein